MDLRLIENIITIANQGTISKASEKLFITQSALNQQLLKLEESLGTPLFDRKGHRMTPTYAGRVYLETARKMVEMQKETYHIIHDIADGSRGEIRIAYTPERGSLQFSLAYPVFHAQYPNISFQIHEVRSRKMLRLLTDGTVDIANISILDNHPGLDYAWADTEQMVLAVSRDNPLARHCPGKKLPLLDPSWLIGQKIILNSQETLMRRMVDTLFLKAGIKPDVLFETSSTRTILNVAESNLGVGFVPQSYASDKETMRFFTAGSQYEWKLAIAHRKGYYLSNAERAFIRALVDVYPNSKPR